MTNTTTLDRPLPRSYLAEEKKVGLPQNVIFACESNAAGKAGDEDAAWAWLALAKIPESAKFALKNTFGEKFLRAKGFEI
jgi:hypothetical protein